MPKPASHYGHPDAGYGYNPTPVAVRAQAKRDSNANQRDVEHWNNYDTAREMHTILAHQNGVLASSLPVFDRTTGDRDLTGHIASMTREMQRRGIANPTRNPLPEPVRTTDGSASTGADTGGIVPRPAGPAPSGLTPADVQLRKDNSPPSGRVIDQPTVYDPRQDTASPVTGLAAKAAASPGTTVSAQTPYGPAGVKVAQNWQQQLVAQYPSLAVPGHPLNEEFVKRFAAAGSDPASAPAIAAAVHADSPESAQISPADAEAGAPAVRNAPTVPPETTYKPIAGSTPPSPPESAVVAPWDAEAGAPALNPVKDSATVAGQAVNRTVGNAARYMGASAASAGNLAAEGANYVGNFVRSATGSAPVPFTPPFDNTYKPVKSPNSAPPVPFAPASIPPPAAAPKSADARQTPLGSTAMNEDPTIPFSVNPETNEFKKRLTSAPANVYAYT